MAAALFDLSRVIVLPNILMLWGMVNKDLPPKRRQFFYLGVPPWGLEHLPSRFVMLCHIALHTPIYSAYTFKHSAGEVCANVPWMYEPQVGTASASVGLSYIINGVSTSGQMMRGDTMKRVAVLPLILDVHQPTMSNTEQAIHTRLNNYCRGLSYIINGVSTSGQMMRGDTMKRVAVLAYLWSAYCCPHYDHRAPFKEEDNEMVEVSVQKLQDGVRPAKETTAQSIRFVYSFVSCFCIFMGNCYVGTWKTDFIAKCKIQIVMPG
uniref:Uncharacterized protein n=1 Tax=Periophthalmus magnuspinnatus TaxID=409849 RepID=A0A3B4AWP2_9GOBI